MASHAPPPARISGKPRIRVQDSTDEDPPDQSNPAAKPLRQPARSDEKPQIRFSDWASI